MWLWLLIALFAVALTIYTEIVNMGMRRALGEVKLQRDMLLEVVETTNRALKEAQK